MTSHERTTYWQQHIDQHFASGLSGTQYCQQAQLTYHCFSYWRRKLATVVEENKPQTINAFVAVRPQSPPQAVNADIEGRSLQLALPSGLIIRNIQDGNLHTVRSLLVYL